MFVWINNDAEDDRWRCNIPTLGKWSTRPSAGGWGTDELDDESSAMDPKIKSWVFGYTVILFSLCYDFFFMIYYNMFVLEARHPHI